MRRKKILGIVALVGLQKTAQLPSAKRTSLTVRVMRSPSHSAGQRSCSDRRGTICILGSRTMAMGVATARAASRPAAMDPR